jgi:hypothetical protein
MTEHQSSGTFVENLRLAVAEDAIGISGSLKDDLERWSTIAGGISEIASSLYPEDVEGRRVFTNRILGIEATLED